MGKLSQQSKWQVPQLFYAEAAARNTRVTARNPACTVSTLWWDLTGEGEDTEGGNWAELPITVAESPAHLG